MEKSKKFIGLVGIGHWGQNILRNLIEMDVLCSVYDSDEKTLKEKMQKHNEIACAESYEEILENDLVRAVAIVTPAVTHFGFVKKALEANKDVFVEKPLSLTVKEGKELVALAKEKSRILMVGHILQYHPAVLKLKEMVDEGDLGKIRYIYSNRLNIGKLRTEENILWSFAPHDISVILMLMGEEPSSLRVFAGDYINQGISDVTLTTLSFKHGVKGHVFVSWLHPFKEQKLIIVGSKAMIVFNDVSDEKLFLYPHTIEWKEGKIPVAHKADYEVIPVGKGEPLRLELQHFVECVEKRIEPRTNGEEGLRVLKVLEKAENSIRRNNS